MQFLYNENEGNVTQLAKDIEKRSKFYLKTASKILELLQPGIHIFEKVEIDTSTGEEKCIKFLTKAGARLLCNLFELQATTTTVKHNMPSGDVAYESTCEIKDKEGKVVSIGVAEQSLFLYRNNNTTLKMSRKSALVDAVLTLFGLDDHLAQDEDYVRQLSMSAINPNLNKTESTITPEFAQGLANRKGVKVTDVLIRYGVSSMEELNGEQLNDLVQALNSKPDAGQTTNVGQNDAPQTNSQKPPVNNAATKH